MTQCWRCGHAIDATDRYCRACGEGQGPALAWYYRPIWIVLLALTALGPFAVILIWRTPALGRTSKWIASIALIAITIWIGWSLMVDVRTLLDG
jgi:hypothetical protein